MAKVMRNTLKEDLLPDKLKGKKYYKKKDER
jgi:hypothetical protein